LPGALRLCFPIRDTSFCLPKLVSLSRFRPVCGIVSEASVKISMNTIVRTTRQIIAARYIQLPTQLLLAARRQPAAEDTVLQTPPVSIHQLVDLTPSLRLGNVVTD